MCCFSSLIYCQKSHVSVLSCPGLKDNLALKSAGQEEIVMEILEAILSSKAGPMLTPSAQYLVRTTKSDIKYLKLLQSR